MNKRERGYIYIFTIILISLLGLFFYYIYSYTSNTAYINLNRVEKIQSKYSAESLLNIKISEENFGKELEKFIESGKDYKNLTSSFTPSDSVAEKLFLRRIDYKDENKKEVDLVEVNTVVRYKKSLAGAKIKAHYINKIYKEEDGLLNSGKVNKDNLEKIKNSFENNNWSREDKKAINLEGDFIYGMEEGKNYIFEEVEEIDEKTGEKITRRNPLYSLEGVDVIIQKSGSLNIESDIKNEILIINDKVLFNDNAISGIIILNNNAQVSSNCKLDGYLVDLYDKNIGISTEYNSRVLSHFSSALPEYIKFQPISLSYYDLEDNT